MGIGLEMEWGMGYEGGDGAKELGMELGIGDGSGDGVRSGDGAGRKGRRWQREGDGAGALPGQDMCPLAVIAASLTPLGCLLTALPLFAVISAPC